MPISVRHALLALLSDGPNYRLQARQGFGAHAGKVRPLNVGQPTALVGGEAARVTCSTR